MTSCSAKLPVQNNSTFSFSPFPAKPVVLTMHGEVVRADLQHGRDLGFDSYSGNAKDLKIEPIAIVLGAEHNRSTRENKVSHNLKAVTHSTKQ